ncbi:HAMP domain-containing histidine kinase [Paenibacillus sp. IB182496]|uniref:histidine kinase n=2 Tax=Paenibacillus sabuli TaxID=2772509 RepID=A0A927GSI4_9BACL|nr:HAMP domain-containing histidine kinase [Paenibacillus sabuli]
MTLRLLGEIVLSMLLSMLTYAALVLVANALGNNIGFLTGIARLFVDVMGFSVFSLLVLVFCAVVYFVLLQWRRFRYFAELSEAIAHIADGNFDHKAPVRQRNEIGDLASSTNRLVEQLKTSMDEERRAEQTKNELITNVSHDLRTPLTSIIGYLGLIEQDRYRDEVELRHYVQIAYDKSNRLNLLINDLFEYTRMRHDTTTLRAVSFNLTELLGELLAQYRLQLEQAGMTSAFHSSEPGLSVNGDPNKIVRVFENLLSNAMAYGREGKRIEVRVWREGRWAAAEVANYGEPIPEVDLPHLFDRFYRADKSRTAHNGGSGLGLAIAKSIVEKHGGTISVSSDEAVTAFRVLLPLAALENGGYWPSSPVRGPE